MSSGFMQFSGAGQAPTTNTRLVFYGQKVIDLGVPVVTFQDDPAWDGHNPAALPPDVRPADPGRNFGPFRFKGNIGPQAMRGHISMMVVHHDACLSARQCFKVLLSRGLSTHFIIDNDGIVYQPWDLCHATWHAGSVNGYSIGFDMSNAAVVQFASHYRDRGIFTGVINGGTFTALGYSEAQYMSCIAAIRELTRFFPRIKPIPPIGEDGLVVPGKIANDHFEGVVGHYHLSVQKWDPGPGFDWKRIFNAVHGGGFAFPLSLGRGGDGANIMGSEKAVANTASRFYRNNESFPGGGWYPVGLNGTWHSGIHLHGEVGQRVNNVYDGEIIAARFAEEVELGSPSFVLIRHKLKGEKDKEKVFYSLYMHLNKVNFSGGLLPWMIEARAKAGPAPKSSGGGAWDSFGDDDPNVDPSELQPKVGKNFWALTQGKVAVFDPPIELRGNMLVGYMGRYGTEDEATAQIDFAIFAKEQIIDLKKFQRDWMAMDDDLNEDIICDITEVIQKVDVNYSKFSGRGTVSSEEITKFFNENPARAELRSYVTHHISEWWANTDWKEALQRRNIWAWDTERKLKLLLRRMAPFQWYSEELAKQLELPEDGIIYTYHPIRFIYWLAKTQGGTNLQVDKYQRGLTAQEMEEARKQGLSKYEDGNWLQTSATGEEIDLGPDWGEDDVDLGEWKRTQGPGEWPPEDEMAGLFGE